jgi:AcrR family transcriptional regulator
MRVTVDEIRKAALGLFLDRGYRQATMADVAEQAGVTEAEVREVFANKEDLLEAVLGRGYDDVEALLDSDDLTPEVFLERYVDLCLADRKELTLTMVDSGVTTEHPTLGPRVGPLAARMLSALGATDDEASRVHAWAALATVESTIAFQPGIESARMRAPLLAAARGALRGAS